MAIADLGLMITVQVPGADAPEPQAAQETAMKIDIILEPDVTPAQITELGLQAESHGINRIWVQNYSAARDCFMSLVPLALASKRIGVGVMVVSPWEMHPLKMANALLTLNEYSKGRAALCVGGGAEWNGIMGIPIARRVRAVREATELLKQACGERKVTSYKGEMYKASHYSAAWASDVPPLIYTGAGQEQMIRMSATRADGIVLSDAVPKFAAAAMGFVRDSLPARAPSVGPFRVSNFWAWHVKADREAALKEARRELIIRSWLSPHHIGSFMSAEDCQYIQAHKAAFITAWRDRSGDIKGVPQRIIDALIEGITTTGDPGEMDRHIARLREFKAAGLDELALRLHDDPADAIALIGRHVVPALQ
jgi:alkanesulfonate monooxygenase SsuD/methylene tetrahydromethanopterin reductase-like flavin-dependent oxidoreductase (luciferase family)